MQQYIYFENESVQYIEQPNQRYIDINLEFCGIERCKPCYSFGPAVREQYIIHYILEGKGTYSVKGKKYTLEKNQGFLIRPGDLTIYEADEEEPWTYIWIAFNGIKAEQYLSYANLGDKNLIFKYDKGNELENYIEEMVQAKGINGKKELKLQGLLYLFLSTIVSEGEEVSVFEESRDKYYVDKSVMFINNNYINNIKVSDIANYIGLNRSYLFTLFKKHLNLSPQEYLIKVRINRACELLKQYELSICDVSRSIGYSDSLAFSKVFKKHIGISPKEYRKKIKEDGE